MPEVDRSALVTHSPAQMYALVRDVERYPEFLSWVVGAEVHEETEDHQLAQLDLEVAGFRRRIRTRNELEPDRKLELRLVEGPFRRFSGRWQFHDLGIGCRVQLTLAFEFDSAMLAAAFSRAFVSVANRMIDDFCRRAEQLHG